MDKHWGRLFVQIERNSLMLHIGTNQNKVKQITETNLNILYISDFKKKKKNIILV